MPLATGIASYLAVAFMVVQSFTCATAAIRCRRRRPCVAPDDAPPITLVRPLCGIESHAWETLEASFLLDYPRFELLFCVARSDDPVIDLVRRAMAKYPGVDARLLIGDDPISGNPKLNNMAKGWREARYDLTAFADSNLLVPRDYLARILSMWGPGVGLVSAPPVGLAANGDFWSELECAFLNSYQARWQYFVDAFGMGFAQGKTLFYRRSLIPGGVESLAIDPAEDSATTKIVRKVGRRIVLARPPFLQPLARSGFREVWARQCRWARLRRLTFPHLFAPEILTGCAAPLLCAAVALSGWGAWTAPVLLAYAFAWYAAEAFLIWICGWGLSAKGLSALILRDLLLPVLWTQALAGTSYVWKGQAIKAGAGRAMAAD